MVRTTFAVCKEALNCDIVHEKGIYIEKKTGHVYVKDNGTSLYYAFGEDGEKVL